jgi:hypothetical protein
MCRNAVSLCRPVGGPDESCPLNPSAAFVLIGTEIEIIIAMSQLENLKAELAAIDHLNRFYWQTEDPDRCEKLGYLVRQERRRELIIELLMLVQETASREECRRVRRIIP